jgi:hypothetical protein
VAGYTDPVAPTNITVSGLGNHTIYWCVTDNLDNNSCNVEGEWYKDVTVLSYGSNSSNICGLTGLMFLVLVAALIVSLIYAAFAMMTDGFSSQVMISLLITAITVLIILVMSATVNGIMCV